MINMHTHTINSFDGIDTINALCEKAIECNLQGLAFTDHVPIANLERFNTYECIKKCKEETFLAKQKYFGKLNFSSFIPN